jgi:CheY-like chemotaxis protein
MNQTSNDTPTLLLVDDDDTFRSVLTRALEKRGFSVTSADSVEAALPLAQANPPAVAQVLAGIKDYLGAAKLLGAGGGGYLLLFAKDETAAAKIKQELAAHPPNSRARFVDFSLSETGLQLTRS